LFAAQLLPGRIAGTMSVAILTLVHVEPYKALMLHAYEHAPDAFTSTLEERLAEADWWWAERIAHPHGMSVTLGAFEGDQLVGAVSLEFSPKTKILHKVLVVGVYVHPEARGQGHARALLQGAIRFCRDWQDIRSVQLEVVESNAPAVALYQSLGFETYGVEPMAVLTPSGFKSKLHMWLHLPVVV
jgi:ribosomal protein S18 acetylase RimI-like enzyme